MNRKYNVASSQPYKHTTRTDFGEFVGVAKSASERFSGQYDVKAAEIKHKVNRVSKMLSKHAGEHEPI